MMQVIRYGDSSGAVHYAALQQDGPPQRIVGDIFSAFEVTSEPAHIDRLLAPIAPTAVLAIGLNYRLHADEGTMAVPDHPVVFTKSTSAVQDPGGPITIPRRLPTHEVDYEGELAVVIGTAARDLDPVSALDHVLGYTCANDVSARDWQLKWGGGQWWRGKSFDTFLPLGPALVLRDAIPDPSRLRIVTTVNGRVMQDGLTADMIFDVPTLLAFLSADTTLTAGTVVLTGTPHGVGFSRTPPVFLHPGDEVVVEIDGIGRLENVVA